MVAVSDDTNVYFAHRILLATHKYVYLNPPLNTFLDKTSL